MSIDAEQRASSTKAINYRAPHGLEVVWEALSRRDRTNLSLAQTFDKDAHSIAAHKSSSQLRMTVLLFLAFDRCSNGELRHFRLRILNFGHVKDDQHFTESRRIILLHQQQRLNLCQTTCMAWIYFTGRIRLCHLAALLSLGGATSAFLATWPFMFFGLLQRSEGNPVSIPYVLQRSCGRHHSRLNLSSRL